MYQHHQEPRSGQLSANGSNLEIQAFSSTGGKAVTKARISIPLFRVLIPEFNRRGVTLMFDRAFDQACWLLRLLRTRQ